MTTTVAAIHTPNGSELTLLDRVLRSAWPLVIAVASITALYFGLAGKLDRITEVVADLRTEIADVKQQNARNLKPDDLRLFCLEAQLRNKNWTCPLVEQPKAATVRVVPVKPVVK